MVGTDVVTGRGTTGENLEEEDEFLRPTTNYIFGPIRGGGESLEAGGGGGGVFKHLRLKINTMI